jgi:hypothetical protein
METVFMAKENGVFYAITFDEEYEILKVDLGVWLHFSKHQLKMIKQQKDSILEECKEWLKKERLLILFGEYQCYDMDLSREWFNFYPIWAKRKGGIWG